MCVYPTQQLTTLLYTLHCYLGRWQRQVQMHQGNTIAQIQLQHHLHFRPTNRDSSEALVQQLYKSGADRAMPDLL